MKEKANKVVIVGAGMAGLTAAAYLCKEEYDVLILDKNDRIGGLVSTFDREGFSFDTGPRAFVNSGMVKPILNDLDIEWEVVNNKISIAIEDQLIQANSLESIDEYKRILVNLYPEDKEDIEAIMSVVYKLSKDTAVLYEFDNPNFVDYVSDKKVLFKQLIPWTFRLLKSLRSFNKYQMPMEDFLKEMTNNQSLIDILTQFFFKNTPTYFALGYFQVYLDYFYPKRGTGSLPKVIYDKINEHGGKIKLNTKISGIDPSNKVVIDTEGNTYKYDNLIWAADLKTLYKQISTEGLSKRIIKRINKQSSEVLSAKAAESVFVMSVAVNRPTSFFKSNGGEHMFYSPSKDGLGDVNRLNKQDILEHFEDKSKEEVMDWLNNFCLLNTYEVSIPALRDSSLAPKGKTGVMISCLFDYDVIKKIEARGWIEDFKLNMEDKIIEIFSENIYKDFKYDILFKFSTTPLTIEKITGNSEGAIVGWSFENKAPVYNKLKDLPKTAFTVIPNVYKASQWAYAPAGVPIAMLTGWHASQKIFKKTKKK